MQKKKGLKIVLSILIPILLIVGIFFYVKAVFLTTEEESTYSFSGYVYADGVPLEGAIVSCSEGTATTSDRGYYIISGVKNVVSVTATKEGYFVENNLKYASESNTQIDFDCYKYFDKYGVVENNGNLIANATVRVKSKAGVFTTTTNLYGEFYLPKLAGEVSIEVVSDTTEFFTQSFDITQDKLVLNGSTTISGKLKIDKGAIPQDFTLRLNDKVIEIKNDFSFEVAEVSCGDTLTLTSEKFHIDNGIIKITEEKQQITFNCYKYYSANLTFTSGSEELENTAICVNNSNNFVATNSSYTLSNLYGECELTFTNDYFTFNPIKVNGECNVSVKGYFTLNGIVNSDDNLKDLTITHKGKEYSAENGKFKIENCMLGEEVQFSSNGYYIADDTQEITSNTITVNKEKLYTINIAVSYSSLPLDLVATINGIDYDVINGVLLVENFYGVGEITLSLDGYVFEEYLCDYLNSNFEIEPYKIYTLSGVVKSGEIILDNAIVTLNNEELLVNSNGQFEVSNLYLNGVLEISCEGYNSSRVSFDVNNNELEINLDYNIDGYILCDEGVSGVNVTNGEISTISDRNGYFKLENLSGENTITFEKDFYNFESVSVTRNNTLNVSTTYSITGSVETGDGLLANFDVILISLEDNSKFTTTTNAQGVYTFDNLCGEYILAYDGTTDIVLKPLSYDVAKGGEYNFADKGYAFGGKVTSGGKPVSDVIVKAGDIETITNANGEYQFDLLTKPCVVTLSKEGYTFENNNLQVNDEYDLRSDIDFNCSYAIKGVVRSGSVNLNNAILSIQGKTTTTSDGVFEITGVTGEARLTIQLEGYTFGNPIDINGYVELDINGYYSTNIYTCTGDIAIDNAVISFKGSTYTTNNGLVSLTQVYGGDSYTISKDGYNFSTYTFGEYIDTNVIDVTYNISGTVTNAGVGIVGAEISLGGVTTNTDNYGMFTLNNIRGENTLTITKDSFEFKEYTINKPTILDIVAMFKVNGYVLVDSIPLSGVLVTIAGKSTTTNNAGYFEITRIDEESEIILEKNGYEFGNTITVNTNKSVTIFATYSISGVIATGNIKIAGARIIASDGQETTSDMNGYYILSGIDRVVSIEVIAENYDNQILENISGYSNSTNINLTYSVVLNFIGEYNNIRIGINNIYKEYSMAQVILTELTGENVISYNKMGYTFMEDVTGSVICYEVRNIKISLVYSVTGKVTTVSGYAIPNAVVSAGGKKAITNADGEYVLEGLSNTLTVKASIENEDCLFEVDGLNQVSYETTLNLTFTDKEYFYYLTMLGYENLRNSYAYLVVSNGVITPNTSMSGPQDTLIIYRKDGSGKRLSQNINYGKPVDIAGVDPRVGFLTYYDTVNGDIMYKRAEGDDIGSNKVANYSKYQWQTDKTTPNDYLQSFGTMPDGFHPYIVLLNSLDKKKVAGEYNGDTISKISNISKSGNNYTYTIELITGSDDIATSYYRKQMKFMVPKQTCKSFSKVEMKFTISSDGKLKDLIVNENYTVEAMSFSVNTDARFDYSFNMYNEGDSAIVNIDTTDSGVSRALSLDGVSLSSIGNLDAIIYKRREVL